MKILCRIFGHRFAIKGITGHYEWCDRCEQRRDAPGYTGWQNRGIVTWAGCYRATSEYLVNGKPVATGPASLNGLMIVSALGPTPEIADAKRQREIHYIEANYPQWLGGEAA